MPGFNIKDEVFHVKEAGLIRGFYGVGVITDHFVETEAFPEVYRVEYRGEDGETHSELFKPEHLAMAKPNPLQPRKNGKSQMPLSDSISAVPRIITQGMFAKLTILECQECSALTWNLTQFKKHIAWHNTQVKMVDFIALRTDVLAPKEPTIKESEHPTVTAVPKPDDSIYCIRFTGRREWGIHDTDPFHRCVRCDIQRGNHYPTKAVAFRYLPGKGPDK